MIDVYDEMGYIKEVLEHGFNDDNWVKGCTLLAKYYRDEGVKRSEIKKMLKDKCEKYCSNKSYNPNKNGYKIIDKIVNGAFKKDKEGNYVSNIRSIKSIATTKEVIQWFLDLENNYEIDQETVELERARRPKVYVKKKPMTFNRIKYLFTLFVWTKIQENYLERPNIHYLKGNTVRFKECADLKKSSFSLTNERNFLYDLGFIDINHGLGVIPVFMDNYDVFQIPVTDENKVEIKDEDLKYCGYWLLKQKMGSFVCQNCGREFAYYTNSKNERKTRKYCKDCANLLGYNKHPNKKEKDVVLCTVCKEWKSIEIIDGKIPNPFICEKCKKDIFRLKKTKYMREYRKVDCNHEELKTDDGSN